MSQAQKAGNHLRIVRHGTHQARAVPGGNHPFQFQHVVKGVLVQQTVAEDGRTRFGSNPATRALLTKECPAKVAMYYQKTVHS